MVLRKWEDLPSTMKTDKVKYYYDILNKKRLSLYLKRMFDFLLATITCVILSPLFILISTVIKIDSKGPVMFRQIRITQYGKEFTIFKFRTMVLDADKTGSQITLKDDLRVTKVGKSLRKFRLDEIPQLINIIAGDMSFVGTRPEVGKYVEKYTDEMMATLLLPAGVTSEASIQYKDEELLLDNCYDANYAYVNKVLPDKMTYNLKGIKEYSLFNDIKIILRTIVAVFKIDRIKSKKLDKINIQKENIHI